MFLRSAPPPTSHNRITLSPKIYEVSKNKKIYEVSEASACSLQLSCLNYTTALSPKENSFFVKTLQSKPISYFPVRSYFVFLLRAISYF